MIKSFGNHLYKKLRLDEFSYEGAWKSLIWMPLGILFASGVLVLSQYSFEHLMHENKKLRLSMHMEITLTSLEAKISAAETSERGFLLTGQPNYLDQYKKAIDLINALLVDLKNTAAQINEIDTSLSLSRLINDKVDAMDQMIQLVQSGEKRSALDLFDANTGKKKNEQISSLIHTMQKEHELWATAYEGHWKSLMVWTRVALFTLTGITIAMILVATIKTRAEMNLRAQSLRELQAHRSQLEQTVRRRTAELSDLASTLQRVQEEERANLARELHDEMGSILTSVKIGLGTLKRNLKKLEISANLDHISSLGALLDSAISMKRRIIEDLRPSSLEYLGVKAAIDNHLQEIAQHTGIKVKANIEDIPKPSESLAISLFRIVQEATTNTIKYAQATEIECALKTLKGNIILIIRDNGIGFIPSRESKALKHGLRGMKHRAYSLNGTFRIYSNPEHGTLIRVSIPAV